METVEAKIVIQGTISKKADGTICILANRPAKIIEIMEITEITNQQEMCQCQHL